MESFRGIVGQSYWQRREAAVESDKDKVVEDVAESAEAMPKSFARLDSFAVSQNAKARDLESLFTSLTLANPDSKLKTTQPRSVQDERLPRLPNFDHHDGLQEPTSQPVLKYWPSLEEILGSPEERHTELEARGTRGSPNLRRAVRPNGHGASDPRSHKGRICKLPDRTRRQIRHSNATPAPVDRDAPILRRVRHEASMRQRLASCMRNDQRMSQAWESRDRIPAEVRGMMQARAVRRTGPRSRLETPRHAMNSRDLLVHIDLITTALERLHISTPEDTDVDAVAGAE